jgi:iron complex transport system ATP-binding protein
LRADKGEVRLHGDRLATLTRNQIARRAAFVPQDTGIGAGFTAYEVVAMGRLPDLGRFRPEGAEDLEAIEHALVATETAVFRNRYVHELSGGERQRVLIARALAQSTPLMVLDEPTANLDLSHQIEVLALVKDLCRHHGHAAVAAIHDLGVAAQYCDRIAIVFDGHIVADGPPADVVTPEHLKNYFHVRALVREESGYLVVIPLAAEKN